MDISKIDIDIIELFDLSYKNAKDDFGVEPIDASAKMRKKIRKWIEKTYIAGGNYPENVMQYIGKEVSDEDFIKFIKACYDQVELDDTRKKQLFDKSTVDFTKEVKDALRIVIEEECCFAKVRKVGKNAQFDVGYHDGYDRTLTLVNASGLPEENFDYLDFENGSLIKQGDEYILSGKAENYDDDSTTPFSIRFTDAEVDVTLFRASEQISTETPWHHLATIAGNILSKQLNLSGDYLNDREKELLPLIQEISALGYWMFILHDSKTADFSQLKSYIVRFGYNELLPVFENLEKNFSDDKKKNRIIRNLISKLNTQKYEPLWRDLYNTIVETQAEYPTEATAHCPTELLNETRSNIQKLMEFHGYSGTYPDFIKKGTIRGIHLVESYGMSYFVGAKKNVAYHIHCTENYYSGYLSIDFLCGTEILRKGETAGDIYSCMFDAKGRRLFKRVSYESDHINPDGDRECETQDLELRVQIAVKKAELIKLTKEEEKELLDFDFPYWKLFLLVFVFMGGLFGFFMTIALMLMGILLLLIFAIPQEIPSMFSEIPWWALFLLAWVLFGGAMGVITVLAKRKSLK